MVAPRRLRGGRAGPPPPVADAETPPCPLCGRPLVAGPSVDLHHLVPRSHGGREAFAVHRVCHHKIHATLAENELARGYHDWSSLRAHPEIAAFVRWLAGKPPEFYDRSRRPRRRR